MTALGTLIDRIVAGERSRKKPRKKYTWQNEKTKQAARQKKR